MITIPLTLLDPLSPVGVHFLPATSTHPPLRIFYPATHSPSKRNAGWFDPTSTVDYLEGYLHTFGVLQGNSWASRWIIKPVLHLVSLALPITWLRLPGVYQGSEPSTAEEKYPLVIFSHGLTGTGQENSALCASWAKEGMVVASVWHTDGSSCRVTLADGTIRYYESPPPNNRYDPNFRPRQVQQRADELFQVRNFLLEEINDSGDSLLQQLGRIIDPTRVVAAGYSYGAATVARAVIQMLEATKNSCTGSNMNRPHDFQALIFLDGWFHIDMQESAGIEFEFPKQAFDYLEKHDDVWPIPSLYLNSEQFQGYPKLFCATQKLAKGARTQPVVLEGTGHQNFCDVIFWFPTAALRMLMAGSVGYADPLNAYREIVDRTRAFLRQHVGTPCT